MNDVTDVSAHRMRETNSETANNDAAKGASLLLANVFLSDVQNVGAANPPQSHCTVCKFMFIRVCVCCVCVIHMSTRDVNDSEQQCILLARMLR